MKVLVTGGTGYVGQPIVEALSQEHAVTILRRPQSMRPLMLPKDVNVLEGDLFNQALLEYACGQVDAVIHLVGIIRESKRRGITMQHVHVDGTAIMVDAARRAGVSRFIHMSALGAHARAVSAYHLSKWQAEQIVRSSGIPYTIFRPSVIFGSGGPGPNFVNQLQSLVSSVPLCPVVGDGAYPLQPVAMDTVVDAFCRALLAEIAINQTYELGGPDVITYEIILRTIAHHLHKRFRPLRIPARLMQWLVPWLEHLPAFPLTSDQLQMLLEGNICEDTETVYRELNLRAIPFHLDASH